MIKKITPALLVVAALSLNSCIKDELPNKECDITSARANVANPSEVFFQLSDTIAPINADYGSAVIQFQRVTPWADLTNVAPTFTVSDGAVLMPPSGTERNFANDTTQVYFCIAEDERALLQDIKVDPTGLAKLAAAAKEGHHIRPYYVQFKHSITEDTDISDYTFDYYYLETKKQKYYEWSDPYADGSTRTVPNWASANAGFSTARSSAAAMEYPTVPVVDGGVDGKDCVKLETCSTGSFGKLFKMPLAAGNFFLGTFDMSQALTNTLHATRFGENNTLERKPIKFTGYYKYTPGPQMTNEKSENIEGTDEPAIYCVIYRNHDAEGNSAVLYGDDVETSSLVVARAEIKDWQYDTTDWVPFNLDFTWYQDLDATLLSQKGYNFSIVCSSSKKGATYTGALGSKLYVDNFKIYYETDNE